MLLANVGRKGVASQAPESHSAHCSLLCTIRREKLLALTLRRIGGATRSAHQHPPGRVLSFAVSIMPQPQTLLSNVRLRTHES